MPISNPAPSELEDVIAVIDAARRQRRPILRGRVRPSAALTDGNGFGQLGSKRYLGPSPVCVCAVGLHERKPARTRQTTAVSGRRYAQTMLPAVHHATWKVHSLTFPQMFRSLRDNLIVLEPDPPLVDSPTTSSKPCP